MNTFNNKFVYLKKSGIHNKGIFAKKFIPKGTKIIQYVGEKISKKESEIRSDKAIEIAKKNKKKGFVYIFELNKKYDLDGDVPYNLAKFINHSCNPNCESEMSDEEIWIIALKDIKKEEEILYDYGYEIDHFQDHPCFCGSKNCKGYIVSENKGDILTKNLQKNFKNKKVLVSYYSRTNNTKKIAEFLIEKFNFEIDEITTSSRKGFFGFIKSGYESAFNKKPSIFFKKNPKDYDLVIIGTPVWANTLSSPIRSYLDVCKDSKIVAFCTLNGADSGKTFHEISLKINSFEGLLNINSKNIKNNTFQNQVLEFFRKISL